MGHHHRPRKRFGQHFLSDDGILLDMRNAIHPHPDDHLVEIGPGLGVLTRYLIDQVACFEAIEIDRDLVKLLEESFGHHGNFILHSMDVLQIDWFHLANDKKLRVVGNLPYNISTPLIINLLQSASVVEDMHFLLQKEVGDRLAATVGSHQYGRLSILAQYYCDVALLFEVPPEAFTPPPKVNSIFLRMQPKEPFLKAANIDLFEKTVATAFNQRRKTLRNSLRSLIDETALEKLNIDPHKRAQDLSVDDYVSISNYLFDLNPS